MSRQRVWKLIAFAPVLVVLYANAMFVRNHFYVRGPYLHDSGWFSSTVYHAGIIPRNPLTEQMPYFWGWHITGVVSLGSILSYLFPGDRVEWYCVFQALLYAPLALAMPILVPPAARTGLRSALLVAACSVAFAFSGQVLACVAYPHFEIFASAGIAIMLGGLATGRERLAWIGLAMAIGTREDCGFHAASFLVAALAADYFGRPFPIARRRLLLMAGVGLVSTALMMFLQKRLFYSVDAFRIYITGTPPYAHLAGRALVGRLVTFAEVCGFIWMPILASIVVAVARRDARYLLGWVVTVPWLIVNLTAHQLAKAAITVYTGFPFVGSVFWIAAYGRVEESREPRGRWHRPLVAAAFVSVTSLLGLFFSDAASVRVLVDSFVPAARNPAGIRAFARGLRAREYGDVKLDPAMISWAIEGARRADFVSASEQQHGITAADGFAFFMTPESVALLVLSPLPKCGRVPDTRIVFCTRAERSLPSTVTPTTGLLLELEQLSLHHVHRDGDTIVVDASAEPSTAVFGPYLRLAPGSYVATWTLKQGPCDASMPARAVHVDVFVGGNRILAERDVDPDQEVVDLAFEVAPDHADEAVELRASVGSCAFTIRGLDLKRTGQP